MPLLPRTRLFILTLAIIAVPVLPLTQLIAQDRPATHLWSNSSLSPDERASMVVKEMTLDEKISFLHGTGHEGLGPMSPLSVRSNGGAGHVVSPNRLGIPDIQMSDAAYGVRASGKNGRYATALPCN